MIGPTCTIKALRGLNIRAWSPRKFQPFSWFCFRRIPKRRSTEIKTKKMVESSSSSSEEERSRLEACRSVCNAQSSKAVKMSGKIAKKRGRGNNEKRKTGSEWNVNAGANETDINDPFRSKIADVLNKYLETTVDFGIAEDGRQLSKSEHVGTDASAASKSAVDHIRLFADSPPGALDAACSGKAKKKCNGSAAPKSSRIEDESSDDSEDERMARIQSVVVDAPPPPPRSKPKAP